MNFNWPSLPWQVSHSPGVAAVIRHSTFETGWTARQVLGAHPKNNTGWSLPQPPGLARISHHDCLWDTFGCAVRLLLCICVLLLTGRSNFRPVRSCLGVSGVVFCMALPGPVTWAKVEV